jgi:hypothetical protein
MLLTHRQFILDMLIFCHVATGLMSSESAKARLLNSIKVVEYPLHMGCKSGKWY